MTSKKASVGAPVLTKVDPRRNNGVGEAPGVVTRVHDGSDEQRVNVRVFLDTGDDLRLSNVLFSTKSAAEKSDDESNTDASGVQRVCYPA